VSRQHARVPAGVVISFEPGVPTGLPEASRRALVDRPVVAPRAPQARRMPRGSGQPDATIIIVTENGLAEARLCLESVLANTGNVDCEIRVVDNGSADGTAEYLRELAALSSRVLPAFNQNPLDAVVARNQGLALARGRNLILLSQDCIVAPGWLDRLLGHLDDPAAGLVGPVTNRALNEAQVSAQYSTYGQFLAFVNGRAPSGSVDIRALHGFCLAMRRDVFERVGPLDERLRITLFQEEDYAIRVRNTGCRVICAGDVFVHNAGRHALGHLTHAGIHGERFHDERRLFEDKWAVRWFAYDHFNASQYDQLRRIRGVILQAIPPDAAILMVSRGDQELLSLAPRAWHFPRLDDGTYAGHHPADSAEAIAHLESQRAQGAEFLLIPSTASWWLTYYDGWRQHLDTHYRAIVRDDRTCVVFDLRVARS